MYVVHFKRRSAILTLAGVILAAILALVLAGCFGGKEDEAVTLADDAARVAYLEELGWQTASQPLETLDLQLPEDLEEKWADYAALQKQQGFPFADYGGQTVCRYTFRLTGQCAGCPSAYLTTEELIRGTLLERFPQLREVVLEQGVSEDLLAQARKLLRHE